MKKLYESTIKRLYNLTPGLIKYNLNNIKILMKLFNNPQDKIKTIHIAGTNGKTSTSIILSNLLKKLNYKIGTFISPHLKNFEERYQINLKDISKKNLIKQINLIFEKIKEYNKNKKQKLKPSFFEISTCIAFNFFHKEKVDFAIIETGMGGRLDATNIIKKPILSVITTISKDHQNILGNTIKKIAIEKSKIIKEKSEVLVKESFKTKNIFLKEANKKKVKIHFFNFEKDVKILEENLNFQIFKIHKENFKTNLLGEKEIENILCSYKVLTLLKKKIKNFNLDKSKIKKAISKIKKLKGRYKLISKKPIILVDGAHNEEGFLNLKKFVKKNFKNRKKYLVLSLKSKSKLTKNLFDFLKYFKKIFLVKNNLFNEDYKKIFEKLKSKNFKVLKKKVDKKFLKSFEKKEVIIICGSLYMIGDFLK